MGKRMKCDYCGRTYYKETGAMAEAGSVSGIGDVVGGLRDMSRIVGGGQNYCSNQCKQAAKSGGGSAGGAAKGGGMGIGSAIGGMLNDSMQESKQLQAQEKAKNEQAKQFINNIPMVQFPDDFDEILQRLSQIVAGVMVFQELQLIREGAKPNNLRPVYKAAKPKLDEGLYKLEKRLDSATDEQQFQHEQVKKSIEELSIIINNKYAWKNRKLLMIFGGLFGGLSGSLGLAAHAEGSMAAIPLYLGALAIFGGCGFLFFKVFKTQKI